MHEIQNLLTERQTATVFGDVIFILNQEGQVLTFKELQEKPKTGKRIGDYSALCETREPGEDPATNMLRGIHEELGVAYDQIDSVLDMENVRAWETGFMPGVWASVFVVNCTDQAKLDSLIGSSVAPDGVEIVGWKSPEEFMAAPVRLGVRNILDKFSHDIFDRVNQEW